MAVCKVCEQILLYSLYPIKDRRSDVSTLENEVDGFAEAELYYPEYGLDKCIPSQVRNLYEEALRVERHSPSLFAVQVRRALEAVCVEQGVTQGKLFTRIASLIASHRIPQSLAAAPDLLRKLGNIGAHFDESSVHPLEVQSIKSLFKAIVEYLYVYPHKIREFEQNYQKYRIWAQNLRIVEQDDADEDF